MPPLEAWEVVMDLRAVLLGVFHSSVRELEEIGLQPKSFTLLASISKYPYPANLAKHLFVPPPTITFMVKQLEKMGLVERQAESGDLRRYRLSLTAKGKQVVTKGQLIVDRLMKEKLSTLSRGDYKKLKEILECLTVTRS